MAVLLLVLVVMLPAGADAGLVVLLPAGAGDQFLKDMSHICFTPLHLVWGVAARPAKRASKF